MNSSDFKSLNDAGFFPGPSEDASGFSDRVEAMNQWSKSLLNKPLELQDLPYALSNGDRMTKVQLQTSSSPIRERYGICPDWVPAYFSDQGLPLLTGGMAVQFIEKEGDPFKTFFQLKSVFKHKEKWIIYSGNELIRHEMCHVARGALESTRYEETFAYSTSDSGLRRKIGGALNTPFDNQLVLLALVSWLAGTMLPLFFPSVQSWSYLLYIPFPLIVTLGLLRNANIHRELKRAQSLLVDYFGEESEPVLFRLSDPEIRELSKLNPSDLSTWWQNRPGFRGEFLRHLYSPKSR